MSMQIYVAFPLKRNKHFTGDIFSIYVCRSWCSDLAQPGILLQANVIQICCILYSFEVRKKDTLTVTTFPHTDVEGNLWLFWVSTQYLPITYLCKKSRCMGSKQSTTHWAFTFPLFNSV